MIDLHCHSNFSDGTLSPNVLLEKALQAGITRLALTDHDTVEGLKDLVESSKNKAITIINGIEFSTHWKKHDIHILGLMINRDEEAIREVIKKQNNNRLMRALHIAERLEKLNIKDAFVKACDIAGHQRIGRPHFAQVCVNEGLVKDTQIAFKRFLGRGKCAYVATPWISVSEAVAVIKTAGGQAVIAHPLKYRLTRTALCALIKEFKAAGGAGLEVVSGEMTNQQVQDMATLCSRFQLLASTGSDYHGDTLSRISLGRQQQLPLNCTPIWDQWNM